MSTVYLPVVLNKTENKVCMYPLGAFENIDLAKNALAD